MTILIVDDQPLNLKLLRAILEAEGHTVIEACDGVEALEKLGREKVTAIISDILMPRMDGYRFCSEVRRDPRFGKTPFIFYTATYNSPNDEKLCYDVGADKYLLKPASVDVILATLAAVTENAHNRKATAVQHIDDSRVMKQYSEQLVLKLEEKNRELAETITRLEQSEAKFTAAFLWNPAGMTITDLAGGRLVEVNERFLSIFGFRREEVIGKTAAELNIISAEERAKIAQRTKEKGYLQYETIEARTKTSEKKFIQFSSAVIELDGARYLLMTALDITESRLAEQKLRVREAELEEAQRISQIGSWEADLTSGGSVWSNEQFRLLGLDPQQGTFSFDEYLASLHPEDRDKLRDTAWQAVSEGRPFNMDHRIIRKDGEIRWMHCRGETIRDDSGKVVRMRGTNQDITDYKRTADALRESEQRFRQIAESIRETFYLINPEMTQMFYISPTYEEIWGRNRESVYANPRSWSEAIHPDDRARVFAEVAPKGVLVAGQVEYRIVRPNGEIRYIRAQAFPIYDEAGQVYRFAGIAEDITGQKLVESKLRQSQKLEAIGQLSGGVAHDFNNLLTVILGHVNILSQRNLQGDAAESLTEIRLAGERAANLTRQLLLFARKQAMEMKNLDLNTVIAETIKMLLRILGEDIQLDFRPVHGDLQVNADAGMLDQILLNLAVNARDAMPQGGRLVIETAKVEFDDETAANSAQIRAGIFAVISVTDSGTGIPAALLPKIFDPFFTTKDVGKGTGLGLATVFGIVQQHAGWINAYSEEGIGTTFRVYLPLLQEHSAKPETTQAPAPITGGRETILFVEDDSAIRLMVSKYLKQLGYDVVVASNGAEAVEFFSRRSSDIRLVFTDLVMPGGMNGIELSKILLSAKAELKFIFASGYSDILVAGEVKLTEGLNFLAKPFGLANIAKIIRVQLDSDPG